MNYYGDLFKSRNQGLDDLVVSTDDDFSSNSYWFAPSAYSYSSTKNTDGRSHYYANYSKFNSLSTSQVAAISPQQFDSDYYQNNSLIPFTKKGTIILPYISTGNVRVYDSTPDAVVLDTGGQTHYFAWRSGLYTSTSLSDVLASTSPRGTYVCGNPRLFITLVGAGGGGCNHTADSVDGQVRSGAGGGGGATAFMYVNLLSEITAIGIYIGKGGPARTSEDVTTNGEPSTISFYTSRSVSAAPTCVITVEGGEIGNWQTSGGSDKYFMVGGMPGRYVTYTGTLPRGVHLVEEAFPGFAGGNGGFYGGGFWGWGKKSLAHPRPAAPFINIGGSKFTDENLTDSLLYSYSTFSLKSYTRNVDIFPFLPTYKFSLNYGDGTRLATLSMSHESYWTLYGAPGGISYIGSFSCFEYVSGYLVRVSAVRGSGGSGGCAQLYQEDYSGFLDCTYDSAQQGEKGSDGYCFIQYSSTPDSSVII